MTFDREALKARLKHSEGFKPYAYLDSVGLLTIGYGRMIDKKQGGGISKNEAEYLLDNDITTALAECDTHIPWWRGLDPVRQEVMVDLMFNMGWGGGTRGLSTFKRTLAAIEANDYTRAAEGLRKSKWASQVKSRADRLIRMMETGTKE